MTIAAGTKGLDSAATLNEADAHTQGSRYRFRYSAGQGNNLAQTQFKLCKPNEIATIIGSGQDLIANSEWYETRVTEGAQAGASDGASDLAFWRSRGLNRGASIYPSWDAAPDPNAYTNVAAYVVAYNAALQGYYRCDGLYAGIPALINLSQRGVIKHGWIPSAASWSVPRENLPAGYAPPAVTSWDLWQPTPSQIQPAINYLVGKLAGHKLVSCVWQDGNYWYGHEADENLVVLPGPLGSHLEANVTPVPPPKPPPPPPPPAHHPVLHRPWPSYMRAGDYFGLITGPAQSHGGYYANEKPDVQAIQVRLQQLGYAPNRPGWADGVYEQPTVDAVAAWQHAHYAATTTLYGQVWSDDWTHLFTW